MLIFKSISVIIFILVSGCALSPEESGTKEEVVEPVKIAEPKEKAHTKEVKTAIDPDVMYMLMAAELAGQRGQYAIALEGYMEVAKRVKDPQFAERAAKIAMYMKDGNKTDEAVSLWLKQDNGNSTARKIAALSALRTGNKKIAAEHLTTLLKSDPAGFENTALELANVLQRDGRANFMSEVLDDVASKNPGQAGVYFVQSLLALELKNNAFAESKIRQVLSIQPDWDKALVLQAQIAVFSGDLNKAKALLKTADLKYPGNDKFKKLLAQVLIKASDYEAAVEIYQSIVLANPKDAESRIALGLVHLQLNHEEKAEEQFKHLLSEDEWKMQAAFYLGKIEEKREHLEKAMAWFDKVTDGPFVFDAAISSVSFLVKSKQYEKAEERLNLLMGKFPKQKNRLILMQVGIYGQQEKYEKSLKLLTEALVSDPEQRDLLYTRALVAERLNKNDMLEADLKKILLKNPDDAEALNALGYSLLDNVGRYSDAEKYLQHALKLQPNEAVIMDSYGWLLFKQGKLDKALSYLELAYSKQQENEIAAHLAEVLWAFGKKSEAKKIFNESFKKAPLDEYLLDFKKRILSGEE